MPAMTAMVNARNTVSGTAFRQSIQNLRTGVHIPGLATDLSRRSHISPKHPGA